MEIFGFTFSATDLWLLGICGALIMALIAYRLSLNVQRHNFFNTAALTFRSKILTELEGIYPIPPIWEPELYHRFRQSIPKVETAAAEFRYFVKRKAEFEAAVKDYCEYSKKVTPDNVSAWYMYTFEKKPEDIGPMETFRNIVEHMLSFANEK